MASSTDQKLLDYSTLLSSLTRSKLQSSNPQAFQTINGLIKGVKEFQNFAESSFNIVGQAQVGFGNAIQSISSVLASMQGEIDTISNEIIIITQTLLDIATQLTYLIQVNTSLIAQTVDLSTAYTQGYLIIKDISGNAAVHNITIIGTVEGVVNPVINTNYGFKHIYKNTDNGLYYNW